jgi:hypothetical protein
MLRTNVQSKQIVPWYLNDTMSLFVGENEHMKIAATRPFIGTFNEQIPIDKSVDYELSDYIDFIGGEKYLDKYELYNNFVEISIIYTLLKFDNCMFITPIEWDSINLEFKNAGSAFYGSKRFIIQYIYLEGVKNGVTIKHANMMIIDNHSKVIILYEPNGRNGYIYGLYKSGLLFEKLKSEIFDTTFKKYKILNHVNGFQRYDQYFGEDYGLCLRWCAAYAFLRIRYSSEPYNVGYNLVRFAGPFIDSPDFMSQYMTPIHAKIVEKYKDNTLFRKVVYHFMNNIHAFYIKLVSVIGKRMNYNLSQILNSLINKLNNS